MLESALRISLILTLLCGESIITFAAEFITRHDPDEITSIYTSIYHPINYRRAYNLRYAPLDKSREMTSSSQINEVVFETPHSVEHTNNSVDLVETHTEDVPPSLVSEIPITTTDSTSEISSSIMKPQKTSTTKTAQLLGEGLKNLLSYGSTSDATIFRGTHHKGKGFLSLFEVLKFENSNCSVLVGDIRALHGVCYHEFECKNLGGVAMGACANGVGTCCVFLAGCGETTTQPIVYFESPSYPTPVRESLICVLIVNLRPNVRQLHLDFLMFELNRPSNGECIQDQFVVSGQNINFMVPILCGVNTGQHIYIDVDSAIEKKIFLSVFAKGYSPRSFNIKINQLERDLAPEGCLQYYRAPEGIVKSFNYDQFGTIVDTGEVTYLNNLNYVICIERAKQMCSILYSNQGNGEQYDFQILNKDDDETDIVPDSQAGAGIFNCPTDYIAINQLRLCGERFNDASEIDDFSLNADVRDTSAGPIILPFRSDNAYVGRGFLLMYKQELCT